jgi:hypothetical protein
LTFFVLVEKGAVTVQRFYVNIRDHLKLDVNVHLVQVVDASGGMLDSFHEFADAVGILGHEGIRGCCKTSDSAIGFCSSLEIHSPTLSRSSRNQVQQAR